jgi:hypothetical protein
VEDPVEEEPQADVALESLADGRVVPDRAFKLLAASGRERPLHVAFDQDGEPL